MDFYTKIHNNVVKLATKLNHKSNPLLAQGPLPDTAASKLTLLNQLAIVYVASVFGVNSAEFARKCQNRQISVQEGRDFIAWAKPRLGQFDPNLVGQPLATKFEIFSEVAFNENSEQRLFADCADDPEERSKRIVQTIKQLVVQPTNTAHDIIPAMPKVRTYSFMSALYIVSLLQNNEINPSEFRVMCMFYEVEPKEIKALAQWVSTYFGRIDQK